MILALASIVGVLFASGVFLILQRTLTRIVLGLSMCGNGVNMLLLLTGGRAGEAAFVGEGVAPHEMVDPMPQAMALTAIVINFGMVAFLLALAYRSATLTGEDEVEDDVEDRRIALAVREEEEEVVDEDEVDEAEVVDR